MANKSNQGLRPLLRKCIVCGGDHLTPSHSIGDFRLVRCGDCTLVFVQDRPSPEELVDYYSRRTFEDFHSSADNIVNLNYYFLKLKSMIESRAPGKGMLLDVGCSRGYFLDVMQGWECRGVELDRRDAALAMERHGDRIFVGRFEDYPGTPGSFDAITMQDLLDHVLDPVEALRRAMYLLRPAGLLIVKVHNISCLFARVMGSRFYALTPPEHLTFFNPRSLAVACSRAGLEVLDTMFIGHVLFLRTILYRLSQRERFGIFSYLYRKMRATKLGSVSIHKNLHDIVTVLARKPLT